MKWLDKPRSGKKLSAILWIATFITTFIITILIILLNYFAFSGENTNRNLIDSNLFQYWVDFIEIWIYGLIWFSGFIVVGTTAKKLTDVPQKSADEFLDKLNKKTDNDNNGSVL